MIRMGFSNGTPKVRTWIICSKVKEINVGHYVSPQNRDMVLRKLDVIFNDGDYDEDDEKLIRCD